MRSWPRRRTCSAPFTLLMVLVLLAGVLVSGSRIRSRKHHKSPGRSPVAARWQPRVSSDSVAPVNSVIHESAVKPAPFSKPPSHAGGTMKRSYYGPTVTNLENKLHHFINNVKTGYGASKLAHAVNGVTAVIQQQKQQLVAGLLSAPALAQNAFRPLPAHYGTANELRYGQPFVSKQPAAAGHFKSPGYVPKGNGQGKRKGYPPKAAPPGKYDSLMSDLGISGYKHFENAVIRDLERREELKVEATIHTLFPEPADDDWRPIAASKKPTVPALKTVHPSGPEYAESKVVHAQTEKLPAKRPTTEKGVSRPPKTKPASSASSPTSSKTTTAATVSGGQKHRAKGSAPVKEKRIKEPRAKCWNCFNSTSAPTTTTRHQPSHSTSSRPPTATGHHQPARVGPTYDAAMFYGTEGKPPAALVGAGAHSYSNVEMHYNRSIVPSFIPGPWTPQGAVEVSTQSAPPLTTLIAALSDSAGSPGAPYTTAAGSSLIKKSFSKLVKPYGSLGPQADGDAVTSTTTHRPTGGSQGTTKGTKGPGTKKRTTHKSADAHRRPGTGFGAPLDSVGAGSVKSELRVRKKFDPKYSRNRGSIKFKDALQQNPDQLYR